MKLGTLLTIKAIVCLVFGVLFVLLPATTLSIFGMTAGPTGILMAGFFGATFIGIGLICWLGRREDLKALRNVTLSLFIADAVGTIVALMGQLSGVPNTLGWLVFALWLFFALGLGYFRFLRSVEL